MIGKTKKLGGRPFTFSEWRNVHKNALEITIKLLFRGNVTIKEHVVTRFLERNVRIFEYQSEDIREALIAYYIVDHIGRYRSSKYHKTESHMYPLKQ